MGEQVSEFEREMAGYLGTSHFVMVNSGSSANLAIIEALLRPTKSQSLLNPGDGVLVPSIAWPTTIWPLIQLGLVPVFVDVEADTLAINLEGAQEIIDSDSTKSIRALFPIHPLGLGIESKTLDQFATKNNLVLINDVCEALGSRQSGSHSGTSGLMASFSFYFSHHITTMEGGGIATDNQPIYEDLRSIRSHGWSRDRSDVDEWSFEVHPSMRKFTFISTGFNIRPMEIQAAIGREQLKSLISFVEKRRDNVCKVFDAISGQGLQIIGAPVDKSIKTYERHSWMHIPIRIKSENPIEDRLKVVRFLEDAGIETRPPLTGNFLKQPALRRFHEFYRSKGEYPISDEISQSTFLIGCHHDLSSIQVDYLCEKLNQANKLLSL
jgi:CDP-6-deoxy-D-xylo-4-hexulose-3-dehydrase